MSDPSLYANFWEHVSELRRSLIRALLIITIGMLASFAFSDSIIAFLSRPLTHASFTANTSLSETRLAPIHVTNSTPITQTYSIPHGASLFSKSNGTEAVSADTFAIPPGDWLVYFKNEKPAPLAIFGPLEGMLIALKISFWVGLAATSPMWLFVILQFLLPALQRHERQWILPFVLLSFLFISLGCLFAFSVTIPLANSYLATFNQSMGYNLWSLSAYLDYTLFLLLANAIAFELFAVGIFVVHLGIVSADTLAANRRGAILAAFILGALLTPPDILTQFMLAIPLIILYEGVIAYGYWQNRGKDRRCER